MKQVIVLFVVFVLLSLSAMGQNYFSGKYTNRYLPKQTKMVNNPASPCNKGKEPFIKFLTRWNNDDTFRRKRMRFSEEYYGKDLIEFMQMFVEQLVNEKYKVVAHPLKRVGDYDIYATFFGIDAKHVGFEERTEAWNDNVDLGGSQIRLCFERINGLWFLVEAIGLP